MTSSLVRVVDSGREVVNESGIIMTTCVDESRDHEESMTYDRTRLPCDGVAWLDGTGCMN